MSLIYHPDNASLSAPGQREGKELICKCGEVLDAWNESPIEGLCQNCYGEEFEDEYEEEQEQIIRCPYCGSAFHYIPGFINEGEPLLYTLHVQIEEAVHGGRKAIRQFQKSIKCIEKRCRKIRRLLADGDCHG